VPDATTLLNLHHLLEKHELGAAIFAPVGELLLANGLKLSGGTIVDVTIIAAPSSTKNEAKARDPKMHSASKGGHWHFGMKAHIGVDSASGIVHSALFNTGVLTLQPSLHCFGVLLVGKVFAYAARR
jgi:transposase, IS5 family